MCGWSAGAFVRFVVACGDCLIVAMLAMIRALIVTVNDNGTPFDCS